MKLQVLRMDESVSLTGWKSPKKDTREEKEKKERQLFRTIDATLFYASNKKINSKVK